MTNKMTYLIIGIFLAIGLFYMTMSQNNSEANDNPKPTRQNSEKPKTHQTQSNAYEGLRNMAFSTTAERLGLSLPADKTTVFAVIMDWGMDGAIATTVAYQTGDASLYLSTGGGVIGGGQHQNVNDAAKKFVDFAQSYLPNSTKTESNKLPKSDEVLFYFLTNDGMYVGKEHMDNFKTNSSPWLKLFEEGNKVLTELRIVNENQQR